MLWSFWVIFNLSKHKQEHLLFTKRGEKNLPVAILKKKQKNIQLTLKLRTIDQRPKMKFFGFTMEQLSLNCLMLTEVGPGSMLPSGLLTEGIKKCVYIFNLHVKTNR